MRDSNTISVFDSLKSTIEKYQYNKGEWIKREKINYIDSVKSNEIVVVVEEEIIFPIYNPYAFIYGKFASAKTELETPAS